MFLLVYQLPLHLVYMQDRFAFQQALPPIDPSQDWFLVRGEENSGYTILEFTRNWTTCDDRDRDIEVLWYHCSLSIRKTCNSTDFWAEKVNPWFHVVIDWMKVFLGISVFCQRGLVCQMAEHQCTKLKQVGLNFSVWSCYLLYAVTRVQLASFPGSSAWAFCTCSVPPGFLGI